MRINCIGRRWLDISKNDDGNYEVRIMFRQRRIATLVIEPEEFDKFKGNGFDDGTFLII